MTLADGKPVLECTIRIDLDLLPRDTFHEHLENEIRDARKRLREEIIEYFARHPTAQDMTDLATRELS